LFWRTSLFSLIFSLLSSVAFSLFLCLPLTPSLPLSISPHLYYLWFSEYVSLWLKSI
jgi:hypothetical protein